MGNCTSSGRPLSFREDERGLDLEQQSESRPRVFYRYELKSSLLIVARPYRFTDKLLTGMQSCTGCSALFAQAKPA